MSVLTPFPFPPDWSEPPRERLEYGTTVLPARNAAEQRAELRSLPRARWSWRLLLLEARETAAFAALLWGAGADLFAVPFWPDRVPLTAPVASGATSVAVTDTTLRKFVDGGFALLWRDAHTFELVITETVAATAVTLAAPLAAAFPSGAWLVPCAPGRIEDVNAGRLSSTLEEISEVAFLIEEEPADVTS